MAKFHINGKGVPSLCRATKGNCPFGDVDSHFGNKAEAQEYADKLSEENHGVLPNVSNESKNGEEKIQDFINSYKNVGKLRKLIDNGIKDTRNYFCKPADWENLDNKLAVDYFIKNFGENNAINKTVKFFEENGDFQDVNYYMIKKYDSNYGQHDNEDEVIYNNWRADNYEKIIKLIDDDYQEYNNDFFINEMANVYVGKGLVKNNDEFEEKILDEGFMNVFNEFRENIYKDGKNEAILEFFEKYK